MTDRKIRELNPEANKGILDMDPDACYVIVCKPSGKSEVCTTSNAKNGTQLGPGKVDITKFKTMESRPIIISSLTGSCYELIFDGLNYYLIEVPC